VKVSSQLARVDFGKRVLDTDSWDVQIHVGARPLCVRSSRSSAEYPARIGMRLGGNSFPTADVMPRLIGAASRLLAKVRINNRVAVWTLSCGRISDLTTLFRCRQYAESRLLTDAYAVKENQSQTQREALCTIG
jgi:hypothetical protein